MVGAAVAVVPTLATSATSSPWRWTTSQARKYAFVAAPQLEFNSGAVSFVANDERSGSAAADPPWTDANPKVVTHCRGVGKGHARRYSAFRCSFQALALQYGSQPTPTKKTLWIKVRRQGRGEFCSSITSLSAIPAACLNTSGTRSRKVWRVDALNEVGDWVVTLYEEHPLPPNEVVAHQTFYGYGAGYFEFDWWVANWDSQDVPLETHSATVVITGKWKIPQGGSCTGVGCPPIPGLIITQTS
jgi:hypothetical protein